MTFPFLVTYVYMYVHAIGNIWHWPQARPRPHSVVLCQLSDQGRSQHGRQRCPVDTTPDPGLSEDSQGLGKPSKEMQPTNQLQHWWVCCTCFIRMRVASRRPCSKRLHTALRDDPFPIMCGPRGKKGLTTKESEITVHAYCSIFFTLGTFVQVYLYGLFVDHGWSSRTFGSSHCACTNEGLYKGVLGLYSSTEYYVNLTNCLGIAFMI